jgi:uncharacterized protein
MRFAQDQPPDQNSIRAYEKGRILVNEHLIDRHVVVTPERLIADWAPGFTELQASHLEALRELAPEILLLGTGARLRFPAADCMAVFLQQGIGMEVMDTAAACRTYNILLGEGRRVVAALFMIE